MHTKNVIFGGKNVSEATKALIMIHGRGGSAEDILRLAANLHVEGFALLAPQAENNSWYPLSFLSPINQNEPALSSALVVINEIVKDLHTAGITSEHIYFLGFSQGACLCLEYVARNAKKWGGITAFTGGLIGDKIYHENYSGNFNSTPIFIGTSNPDPHVPVQRVHATTEILQSMHASVTERVYQNMGHTINHDEIEKANNLIFV